MDALKVAENKPFAPVKDLGASPSVPALQSYRSRA